MSFHHTYIPYKETGYFSSLVNDYLAGNAELLPFYHFTPDSEGISNAIAERSKYPVDRKTLVSLLNKQYAGLEIPGKVADNIKLLAKENTFTICTAHQPNLLTGYLYFIYKILHAIKLAEELNQLHPDKHFVPVYYMGSEDNDLEELGSFRYGADTYVWDGNGQKGAVGRMQTKGLKQMLNDLFRLFGPPGANCEQLKDMLHKAYLGHNTIGEATQYLVNELFGRYGLVVLNPDEAEFKKAILPIIKDDLLHQTANGIVAKQIEQLSVKYKAQAHPREINLFYLADGLRERIEKKGDNRAVVNSDITWTEQALLKEVDEHPERFSPNVILRGLLQESILPDVAFIGGGAEVAYWMQLKSLFEHYKVFLPVILLRQSVLWIAPAQVRLMNKMGLNSKAIFAEENELKKNYIIAHSGSDWQTDQETAVIEKVLYELKAKASGIDSTLGASAEAALARIRHQLQVLEKKMLRAEKRKAAEALTRFERLKKGLFPNNNLQERVDNFATYFLSYGFSFFDTIKKAIDPLRSEFLVIEDIA